MTEVVQCWCRAAEFGHDRRHVEAANEMVRLTSDGHHQMVERIAVGGVKTLGTTRSPLDWESRSDSASRDRLDNAVTDLRANLRHYRHGLASIEALQKRAADVANLAFMMADPKRLENTHE